MLRSTLWALFLLYSGAAALSEICSSANIFGINWGKSELATATRLISEIKIAIFGMANEKPVISS